jgi:uncharacterized membrane protein YdbT with pleckstrin-like domain
MQTSMGPLTCFAVNPTGVRFETQEEEERVVLFMRQHIVVNVPWVILAIFMGLAPVILFPFVLSLIPVSIIIPVGYMVVGTVFWYVATFGFILAKFLSWFFNIYIVTNERLVDIDFYYLLYKNFAEADLSKIQDLSFTTGGIFSTLFNYGNVVIQTAGESPNLEFDKVPYPERVIETIRSLNNPSGGNV